MPLSEKQYLYLMQQVDSAFSPWRNLKEKQKAALYFISGAEIFSSLKYFPDVRELFKKPNHSLAIEEMYCGAPSVPLINDVIEAQTFIIKILSQYSEYLAKEPTAFEVFPFFLDLKPEVRLRQLRESASPVISARKRESPAGLVDSPWRHSSPDLLSVEDEAVQGEVLPVEQRRPGC